MKTPEPIYRIVFSQNEQMYELYARSVSEDCLMGFIEIEELVFTDSDTLIIDPSEEKLRAEFKDVRRSYIPMHTILRIDEVIQPGVASAKDGAQSPNNISHFPHQKVMVRREE